MATVDSAASDPVSLTDRSPYITTHVSFTDSVPLENTNTGFGTEHRVVAMTAPHYWFRSLITNLKKEVWKKI